MRDTGGVPQAAVTTPLLTSSTITNTILVLVMVTIPHVVAHVLYIARRNLLFLNWCSVNQQFIVIIKRLATSH